MCMAFRQKPLPKQLAKMQKKYLRCNRTPIFAALKARWQLKK